MNDQHLVRYKVYIQGSKNAWLVVEAEFWKREGDLFNFYRDGNVIFTFTNHSVIAIGVNV